MALTRQDPLKLYDSEGREIFTDQLTPYHQAHGAYLEQIYTQNVAAKNAQDLTTFESLLFPNKPSRQPLKMATTALFQLATKLATEAVNARQGVFFGFGADEAAYHKSAAKLKKLGEYVENKIIETPWYIPVSKKSYLLTALKKSPESFLKLKNDKVVTGYVKNLNEAKRAFPKETIQQDNLPTLSKHYADNVIRARDAYQGIASNFTIQIQTIERQRAERGGFLNFFVDIFTGQDKKLEQLKIQKKALENLPGFTKTTENISVRAQFQLLSNRFINNPASFKPEEIAALQSHLNALSADKKEAANLALFIKRLDTSIFSNIKNLEISKDLSALINQLLFMAENKIPQQLNTLHKRVSKNINVRISDFKEAKNGLEIIEKWERISAVVLQAFDLNLATEVQNKKKQYQSSQFLQDWDSVLNDTKCSQLSTDKIDQFIEAILWLDKPKEKESNLPGNFWDKFTSDELSPVQAQAKRKLVELGKSFDQALSEIAKNTLSNEKKSALINRLKFILPANSTLTSELSVLREKFITTIVAHLQSDLSLKELQRYLDDINAILPKELKADSRLSAAIKEVKIKWVEERISDEQKKLYQKFKDEIEFLKTGEPSLWEKMQSKLNGQNPRELTQANFLYWQEKFDLDYGHSLKLQQELASVLSDGDQEDEKIIRKMLDDAIAYEYKPIKDLVENDLEQLVNIRRKKAFERLDKIFGLEPTQSVDLNMFMLRYAVVSTYQSHLSKHPDCAELIEANRAFVRKFNAAAQNSGGFTTEIVAKLPKAALEAMYKSWADNPNIVISSSRDAAPAHLVHDIANPVSDKQDTHIQVPKFLLLRMVSELIIADFEALLRGGGVDLPLLKDRLEFVLPKLKKQRETSEQQLNKYGHDLRKPLIAELDKLNTGTVNERYSRIIADHMEATHVKADWTSVNILNNQSAHEQVVLEQLKLEIRGLLGLFSTLKPEDIECHFDADDIEEIESKIQTHQTQRNLSQDQSECNLLDEHIRKLIKDKESKLQTIRTSEAKKLCLQRYTDYLVGDTRKNLYGLLDNDSISLKDFIQKVNVELFSLIDDEKLAATCIAIRKNAELQTLLKEERIPNDKKHKTLTETLKQLQHDLDNPDADIVNIVNSINESITREFPAATADMIRQLQYFFADYTITNLAKTLGEEHITTSNKAHSRAASPRFFQSETPEQRLKSAFEFLGSDLVKQLREVLSSQKKVTCLHKLTGASAPIDISPLKTNMYKRA